MMAQRRSPPSAASPRTLFCSTSACPAPMATRWRRRSGRAARARRSSSSPSPAGVRRPTRKRRLPPASITTSPSRWIPSSSANCWRGERPLLASTAIQCLAIAVLLNAGSGLASRAQVVAGASAGQQATWVAQASAGLDPRALDALRQIVGADRRLLALRAYLRAGDSLDARWSWSAAQLAAYPSTQEGEAAAHDIDAVIAAFAAENPGFTLRVNRVPRSLEAQIAHWNQNKSVGITAAAL